MKTSTESVVFTIPHTVELGRYHARVFADARQGIYRGNGRHMAEACVRGKHSRCQQRDCPCLCHDPK